MIRKIFFKVTHLLYIRICIQLIYRGNLFIINLLYKILINVFIKFHFRDYKYFHRFIYVLILYKPVLSEPSSTMSEEKKY